MKVDVERLEKSKVVLTIEVDEKQVDDAASKGSKLIAEKVDIPGFRRGKAPRRILERRLGKDIILQEAAEILVKDVYPKALDEADIKPISEPDISIEQIEDKKPFIFKVTVQVVPDEVKIGEYKGIEVEYNKKDVTDEDVEKELKEYQRRHSELEETDKDTVENGDVVTMDYQGFIDGEAFEGGSNEGHVLKVGDGSFIPGFEEQLIGLKIEEEGEVEVTFPEDYHSKDLAGKKATFSVKVNSIKEESIPELDDEFAKDVGEFETLDELQEDIRKRLEANAEEEAKNKKRDSLVDQVVDSSEVDIPEAMIENEISSMIQDMKQQTQMRGLNFDQYLEVVGKSEEDIREDYVEAAERRVKTSFVLSELRKVENIEVTDEDVDKYIEDRVKDIPEEQREQYLQMYKKPEYMERIKSMLSVDKTIDFIEEHAQIINGKDDDNATDSNGSRTDE